MLVPKFGLFERNTVVGVLLDMDRGVLTFFKDGNELGPAYVMKELKSGSFIPFIHTQAECKLEIFHPSVYPDLCEIPDLPVPPPEPIQTEYSLSDPGLIEAERHQ